MELIWAVLPFVAFLACPLMMVFCVVGMRKAGCSAPQANEAQASSQLSEERVAALQQQLRTIQAELATLQPTEAPAPQSATAGRDDRLIDVVSGAAHAARRPA